MHYLNNEKKKNTYKSDDNEICYKIYRRFEKEDRSYQSFRQIASWICLYDKLLLIVAISWAVSILAAGVKNRSNYTERGGGGETEDPSYVATVRSEQNFYSRSSSFS